MPSNKPLTQIKESCTEKKHMAVVRLKRSDGSMGSIAKSELGIDVELAAVTAAIADHPHSHSDVYNSVIRRHAYNIKPRRRKAVRKDGP